MFLLVGSLTPSAIAQYNITGSVRDTLFHPIPGALVVLGNGDARQHSAVTNAQGEFKIEGRVKGGEYTAVVSAVGYVTENREIRVNSFDLLDLQFAFLLVPKETTTSTVTISDVRVNIITPLTYTNVTKKDIEVRNLGQDLPILFQYQPNLVTTSDAGAGIGYTGLRLRGSDATRVNYTLNDLPINESDAHGVFWVNLPDIASSAQSIQIQRGMGASTHGAGAFGGAVSLSTNSITPNPYAQLNFGVGSFGTLRSTLSFGSGIIKRQLKEEGGNTGTSSENYGWQFDGRLSRLYSNGYIDRAFADLRAGAFSIANYHSKGSLIFNLFTGREQTYQAWNGVPGDSLSSNRTYNAFTYSNQTDNYQQDRYQLIYNRTLNPKTTLKAAAFYTRGLGYFEEFQGENSPFPQRNLSFYGLAPVVVGQDTILQTDLIRQKWLLNDFYGGTLTLQTKVLGWFNLLASAGANRFYGNYFNKVIWAQFGSNSFPDRRYYDDDFEKTDATAFARVTSPLPFMLKRKFYAFADAQVRHVALQFKGIRPDFTLEPRSPALTFFNPKAGLTYLLKDGELYTSVAIGNREPTRDDFAKNPIATTPRPERMTDFELGIRKRAKRLTYSGSFYYMAYKDQLVLTGKVNDVGEYIRQNVAESYRAGVELDAQWTLNDRLSLAANVAFSQNKITAFNEFVDTYDENFAYIGNESIATYEDVDIAFSPNVVSAATLGYRSKSKRWEADWMHKYVGSQFLDNTASTERQLEAYYVSDARVSYGLGFGSKSARTSVKSLKVNLLVNNLFGALYESNGYTYRYLVAGSPFQSNAFYPQAGRNFLLGATLAW